MRTRAYRVSIACFAAAALALLAACGDDDGGASVPTGSNGAGASGAAPGITASPDEEAYLQRVENLMQGSADAGASLNEARAQAFDPAKPEEERRAAGIAYGADYSAYMEERENQLFETEAPTSLDAPHQALIAAAVGTQQMAEDAAARLQEENVVDEAGFSAILADLDAVTLVQRFRDACLDLQTRAQGLGVAVDLRCNG